MTLISLLTDDRDHQPRRAELARDWLRRLPRDWLVTVA